jgi:alkyl sulfatase BDS1-like metallo-beta-lactamase superfamily hydrolase
MKASATIQSPDMIGAIPTGLLLESVATRLDPAKVAGKTLAINFSIADRGETAKISIGNGVLISEMASGHDAPAATVTAPRQLFLAMLFLKMPLAQLEAAGLKIEGDRTAVEALQAALDPTPAAFNIAEP